MDQKRAQEIRAKFDGLTPEQIARIEEAGEVDAANQYLLDACGDCPPMEGPSNQDLAQAEELGISVEELYEYHMFVNYTTQGNMSFEEWMEAMEFLADI